MSGRIDHQGIDSDAPPPVALSQAEEPRHKDDDNDQADDVDDAVHVLRSPVQRPYETQKNSEQFRMPLDQRRTFLRRSQAAMGVKVSPWTATENARTA